MDRRLSVTHTEANGVAGQTRSPRCSSWHPRPKFADLLLGKVCRGWPPGLALQRVIKHWCAIPRSWTCHGVVMAEKVPRQRRRRREARAPELPLTSCRTRTDLQDPSTARRRERLAQERRARRQRKASFPTIIRFIWQVTILHAQGELHLRLID
jgi:hypothetical protein